MKEELKIKKWGGENAAEFSRSPKNIIKDFEQGVKQIVVVSAVRSPNFNTTDELIALGELLAEKNINKNKIESKLLEIKDFHLEVALKNNNEYIKEAIEKKFLVVLENILSYVDSNRKIIPSKENDYSINTSSGNFSIVGYGEILSSEIHSIILNNMKIDGLKSVSVDLGDIASGVNLNATETEIFEELNSKLFKKINILIKDKYIPIIPGYIPGFENGIENAIGRGYTDATAAMTAVGFSSKYEVVLEIQKSVIGMLSADPRIVKLENVKLIEKLDYLTAKEITGVRGAQAKLLHSQVLRKELQQSGIKVHLFDPFKDTKGTVISRDKDGNSSGVEYVGGRANITVFSISSGEMASRGILLEIFSIAKDYASIDIVSTSETEVSFSIEGKLGTDKLEEMSQKIRKALNITEDGYENFVKYQKNKVLIFCIGQNLSNTLGSLGRAAIALSKGGINIEMVSQGTMERAIIFGVQNGKLKEAVNLLHDEFIA